GMSGVVSLLDTETIPTEMLANFDPETMDITLTVSDGFVIYLEIDENGNTTLASTRDGVELPPYGETLTFAVVAKPGNMYTVTVNGSAAAQTGAGEYAVGDTVTVNAGNKKGYTFAGWQAQGITLQNASAATISFTMPAGDVSLTAVFKKQSNPFVDVKKKDYFYDAVLWAVDNGITAGATKTSFAPNDPCTRGQIVTFLWRAAGCPEPKSSKNPFTDVKKSDYYYKAVLWAVENNITAGATKTTFAPKSPCTRGQIAAFLWRAAGCPEPKSGNNPFTDVKKKDFYYKAVLWAVENGITAGTTKTTFGPNESCTRGQIVTFLYRNYN
ncbi:MAG: S-layer homology domain-containing protein, partial [Clostridia bacterium]|nr:S-layer homology domain-containing protein [Clostridia bacterium]